MLDFVSQVAAKIKAEVAKVITSCWRGCPERPRP
jgi:hypothetical protein